MAYLNNTDQELLRLTEEFKLHDWRMIHTDDHFEIRDKIKWVDKKNEFLLQKVREYLDMC